MPTRTTMTAALAGALLTLVLGCGPDESHPGAGLGRLRPRAESRLSRRRSGGCTATVRRTPNAHVVHDEVHTGRSAAPDAEVDLIVSGIHADGRAGVDPLSGGRPDRLGRGVEEVHPGPLPEHEDNGRAQDADGYPGLCAERVASRRPWQHRPAQRHVHPVIDPGCVAHANRRGPVPPCVRCQGERGRRAGGRPLCQAVLEAPVRQQIGRWGSRIRGRRFRSGHAESVDAEKAGRTPAVGFARTAFEGVGRRHTTQERDDEHGEARGAEERKARVGPAPVERRTSVRVRVHCPFRRI